MAQLSVSLLYLIITTYNKNIDFQSVEFQKFAPQSTSNEIFKMKVIPIAALVLAVIGFIDEYICKAQVKNYFLKKNWLNLTLLTRK